MTPLTPILQTISITSSLLAAAGIATISLFDVPILQAQPASRSLPSIRWLFSRGSHIFPTAGSLSCAGFMVLAYQSIPATSRTLFQLAKLTSNGPQVSGYLLAAVLSISIAPITGRMIPTNFELIKMNESKAGARSADSAKSDSGFKPGQRSAEDSVAGKGEGAEFRDLSGPLRKTPEDTSEAEDKKVRQLLSKFSKLNMLRATVIGLGGVVGLFTALAL
ncbi:hypothetical protein AB5N19_05776 [Seiridium cardinale]|uniref:DUF1772-domain-containing protein n=1 Tax=Seiridium cardinale TaxID=138064 RepID=A0ABR2XGZ4_9PEZI